jgi:hypothetical protein
MLMMVMMMGGGRVAFHPNSVTAVHVIPRSHVGALLVRTLARSLSSFSLLFSLFFFFRGGAGWKK